MNKDVDWHARFSQQAGWTRDLRQYLFKKAGLAMASRILEVGCGTGAILADIPNRAGSQVYGLDIDPGMIQQAARNVPQAVLTVADAHNLPYPNETFEISFCHYLLLWVASPLKVLQEMKRVTRTGGVLMAMAEPDYSQRMDEPESMQEAGRLQTASLQEQGADVSMGAKLGDLFRKAGIDLVESGWMENRKEVKQLIERLEEEHDLEWQVLESDIRGYITREQMEIFHQMDMEARRKGTRKIQIPTAFAWGKV